MDTRERSGDGPPGDEELAMAVAAAMRAAGLDDPQAVYLFGSAAHGRFHRESDIDLAILVEHPLTRCFSSMSPSDLPELWARQVTSRVSSTARSKTPWC